ncbi:MAG: YxcD family protein [Bacillus sp. (in: firmicutes)]
MEKLIIPEQDIINALCVYTARNKEIKPEEVEIELMYDDENGGFSAEAYWNGRKQVYVMINIIEALRIWLEEYLNKDPFSGIELVLDDEEGIIAQIS